MDSLFTNEELPPLKDDSPIVDIKTNQVPLFMSDQEKKDYVRYARKLFKPKGVDNTSDLVLKLLKEEYEKLNQPTTKEEENENTKLEEEIDRQADNPVEGEILG